MSVHAGTMASMAEKITSCPECGKPPRRRLGDNDHVAGREVSYSCSCGWRTEQFEAVGARPETHRAVNETAPSDHPSFRKR